MDKLDRLVWADGICLESYGLRIGIRISASDLEVRDRLLGLLPPGWTPAAPPFVDYLYSLKLGGADHRSKARHFHLLYGGLNRLARTLDLEEVFAAIEKDLQVYVAEWARERLFVHAGVVGWRGQAILLPGRSFSGKSTLVEALLQAGATYFSDEYAVLDARGQVHPFPRRLALRQEGQAPRRFRAEDIGAPVGKASLPVGLVAVTRYQSGARWQPRPLSPGQAFLELLNNTVPALS